MPSTIRTTCAGCRAQSPAPARERRRFPPHPVAAGGGHLASNLALNLGAVELAIALHYAFDTPRDRRQARRTLMA